MTLAISLVGTGPVAHALARAYSDAGGVVTCIVSRDPARAATAAEATGAAAGSTELVDALSADVVLVAVSDGAVAQVGRRLVSLPGVEDALFLHTSGVLSGSDLSPADAERALQVGSLHPLQSFTDPGPDEPDAATVLADRVAGAHWFHEGAGEREARALVRAWKGRFHKLAPGGKALYHAGAAVLSNHTVALFHCAQVLFALAGVTPAESHEALAGLLDGTAANLRDIGVPRALTGPVARGDVTTVRAHLDALRANAPDLLPSYVEMARRAVVVGQSKGTLTADVARNLLRLLSSAL